MGELPIFLVVVSSRQLENTPTLIASAVALVCVAQAFAPLIGVPGSYFQKHGQAHCLVTGLGEEVIDVDVEREEGVMECGTHLVDERLLDTTHGTVRDVTRRDLVEEICVVFHVELL